MTTTCPACGSAPRRKRPTLASLCAPHRDLFERLAPEIDGAADKLARQTYRRAAVAYRAIDTRLSTSGHFAPGEHSKLLMLFALLTYLETGDDHTLRDPAAPPWLAKLCGAARA
jgi:hypothetical protein